MATARVDLTLGAAGPPPNGNGGNPPVAGLEPIDKNALQVAIEVGSEPRQTWWGFGFGCNDRGSAATVYPRVEANVAKLSTDIGTRIIRIFTPEGSGPTLQAYLRYWNLFKGRGVDTIFASCFLYRSSSTPQAIANGVEACINGGMNAKYWFLSVQNEPDGNPANAVKGDFVGHHRTLRSALDAKNLKHVRVIGLEWRHPSARGPAEFDAYADGEIGRGKVIDAGCLHIYDKAPDHVLYDQRYMKRGTGVWSTELGNNSSPSAQGRMLAGMNHGSEVELVHYCVIATATPNGEQMGQSLLDWNGNKRPWYGGLQQISLAFRPGSVFRLCQSSDRPAGLPTTHAQRMIRNAAQTGGRNPRQQVTMALRPDGKWAIGACSTTYGSDGFNPYTSGHYGSVGKQQLTLRIPELAGKKGSFSGRRAGMDGSVGQNETVGLADGYVRFTLRDGDTIGLVGGAA